MVETKKDSPINLVRLNARHPYALRIGTGVGSEIYLAMQQGEGNTFQRLVAVKKVATLFDGSGQSELIREIRAAAGLSHPNIVRVYGAEKSGARLLVSMEYVYGHRLSTLMKAMRERNIEFPLPVLLRMMSQACEALHHAHQAKGLDQQPLRLVHRDVSPETIMLDVHGYLRIVDFGLAKLAGGEDTTLPGRVKGRFLYMPLEQMRGDDLDNRSDIFSLGMTFYELATLKKPRLARNIKAAYDEAQGEHRVEPISQVRGCSQAVDELFYKATAPKPEDRFQSARAFSQAIERLADNESAMASAADTELWLEKHFSDFRQRREGFERQFAESVEELSEAKSSPVLPPVPPDDSNLVEDISGSESTTRILMVGILALLIALVAFTLHHLTRDRESLRFTEGFQIEQDENEASVFVLSMPERATLYVDDEMVGKVSRLGVTVSLEPGMKHRLRLELAGYKPYSVTVSGQAGVADQVIAQLEREQPRLRKKRVAPPLKPKSPKVESESQNENNQRSAALSQAESLVPEKQSEQSKVVGASEPVTQNLPKTDEGLHHVQWGMTKDAVARVLKDAKPDKSSQQLDSYRSHFYGRSSIQNFIYLDDGLGAVIYLLPLLEKEPGQVVFDQLERRLTTELGEPNERNREMGQEWRTYWQHERGDILLVWNAKKKRSSALKVMYLSMPWVKLQRRLGHLP